MICTFIGHRDTPKCVQPILREVLVELITKKGVNEFYIGTHGKFDNIVLTTLKELKKEFLHINYTNVLAYITGGKEDFQKYENTVFPNVLENTPPRFAIIKRNKWMIEKSDYVVCYVWQTLTNAVEFLEFAKRKGKKIINLAKIQV